MWLGLAAVDVCPSPNVQLYDNGCPSGSLDPALEKFAVSGAGPDRGLASAAAIGGWLPEMKRIRRSLLTPKVPLMSE